MKLFILAVLPILACSNVQSFLVEPQDDIINSYKSARAILTPEQQEFLMELLAADDALIEEATAQIAYRGIVDDILQALAGAGNSNIRVNIIGGSTQQQQQQPTNNAPASPAAPVSPPYTLINPSFTLVSSGMPQNPAPASTSVGQQEKTLVNSTDSSTSAPVPASDIVPPASSSSTLISPGSAASAPQSASPPLLSLFMNGTNYQMTTSTANTTTTTIGGNNNHLFSTISQVIMNSNRRNVTGIVDESLRIATPAPIREFVTGILQVVYCNGIRRLLGRC